MSMKSHRFWLLLGLLGLVGCEEDPTSSRVQKGVFNLLGGLDVGEMLMLSGEEASQVVLGGQRDARRYMYIPFHASKTDGNFQFRLTGSNVAANAGPSFSRDRVPLSETVAPVANWALHERLHMRMTDAARPVLASGAVRQAIRSRPRLSLQGPLGGQNAEVGAVVEINADAVVSRFCQGIDLRSGRVEAIGERVIVVADVNNPSGGFTRQDYEAFAREFDLLIEPTVVGHFGQPTDIDDNGRVVAFFTRAVNELTETAAEGFISGFFWVRDLVPQAAGCPGSNEAEIFFLLVPDPNGEASPVRHARSNVFNSAVATIAHEYQHLINAGRRIYVTDATALETTWLDEGLAHMAEELLFYAASGLQPRSNLDFEDLTSQALFDAINRFMVQNLARYGLYLDKITSESPVSGEDDLESRGATWAFLRYAADLSGLDDAEFFQLLVDNPEVGFANLDAVLGRDAIDVVQEFGISVYTDDQIPALGPRFQQASWNFRSFLPLIFDVFPLEVERLGPTQDLSMGLLAGTSGYVEVNTLGGYVSRITATTVTGNAPSDQFRIAVIRVE